MHFLIIEPDPQLGRTLSGWLEEWGYSVTWLRDHDAARSHEPDRFDLVLLGFPIGAQRAGDVLELLTAYRERASVPIVALVPEEAAALGVAILDAGADDVVGRDPWPQELRARLRARLRRPQLQRGETLHIGELTLNPDQRTALVGDDAANLTRVEFDLLLALGQRRSEAVERGWLAENVLGDPRDRAQRTLDVHVSRVRKKLVHCGGYLQTVWGIGYRLEPTPPALRTAPQADGRPRAEPASTP